MTKRDSYPAKIDHASWDVDHACPLHFRYGGNNFCRRDFFRPRMRQLVYGCPPECSRRTATLELPGMQDHYDKRQEGLEENGWSYGKKF
jgi:hypothetical protein